MIHKPASKGAERGRAPSASRGAARSVAHSAPRGAEPREERRPSRRDVAGRSKRAPTSDSAEPRLVEIVFLFLYDVGRSVDLARASELIPAHPGMGVAKRRDTPASLTLPVPLILELGGAECAQKGDFECFFAQARIYEEGAVTILVRVKARVPFGELHLVRARPVVSAGSELPIKDFAEKNFGELSAAIRPAVAEPFHPGTCERETYTAFCVLDCPEDPAVFLERNRDYVAALLIDEDSGSELHASQIEATLGMPFSYHRGDLAVFDMDRCLIVDSAADYEDLLLIIEDANYQLLELRVLDKRLDRWLDEAEKDVRRLFAGPRRLARAPRSAKQKFARIQALRFDALFILENLENSSKIIGDYYLGQIYDRLCAIFSTEGWKWSVERRLDTLQSVYEMLKSEDHDRRLLTLEMIFIVVCIVFPIIQIIQVMLVD
jgi:hypothetical protein